MRQLHTPTNFLLLSLAVSDFLVGLLLMPFQILLIGGCWILGSLICGLFYYASLILTSASVGNMVLISVDRYVAICDPLCYPTRVTQRRVKLCVCLSWACALFYNGVIVIDFLNQPDRYNSCYGECIVVIDFITGAIDIVLTFVGPIAVIIVLYMRVFVVAVSQARAMRSHVAVRHTSGLATDVFIGGGKSCKLRVHQPPDGPGSSMGDCRVGTADPSLRVLPSLRHGASQSLRQTASWAPDATGRTVEYQSEGNGRYRTTTIDFRTKARLSDWKEPARCDAFLRGLGEYLKDELVSYELPSSFDDLVRVDNTHRRAHSGSPSERDVRLQDTSPPCFPTVPAISHGGSSLQQPHEGA
ncbi:hypothetical protein L3Q82_004255 [Scortum barcoo]|uniref:Uncharacterized protein n=1 Tax=Scortum barcoo TaxID=214431 RepID=A0ACB8VJU0_9TELE|nr:hypothetical protein L3Q82_004255 [Scortum barcoo]